MGKKKKIKIAGGIVLAVLCLAGILFSPLFKIKKITVNGENHYTDGEITDVLSSVSGRNFFSSLLTNVPFAHLDSLFKGRMYSQEQKLIAEKPYIRSASITYAFPDRLVVDLTERSPAFLTRYEGSYLLVDSEGSVLESFSEEDKPPYPIVEGLDLTGYKTGRSLRDNAGSERLELAIRLCSLMAQVDFLEGHINIIDVSDTETIWMFAKPSLSVKFGDGTDAAVKLSALKGIFQAGYDGNSNGIVDFTGGKNPIFKANEKVTDVAAEEE